MINPECQEFFKEISLSVHVRSGAVMCINQHQDYNLAAKIENTAFTWWNVGHTIHAHALPLMKLMAFLKQLKRELLTAKC